jgi:DNA polymerase-3 subunit gamma/tau
MAGYYRSLLLIKNGITRESLLGYRPSLFSEKVTQALDCIRLEQALEILLDCYRNIRYCVSPRFELEAAVSKLTWLSRWISPAELGAAIEDAKLSMAGSLPPRQNTAAPAAQPASSAYAQAAYAQAAHAQAAQRQGAAQTQVPTSGGGSLADHFKRIAAAKESGTPLPASAADEDDVPVWDSVVNTQGAQDVPPEVEKVLSVIPGTIVN